ncbi:HET-like protein [Alternaria alternata]|nr:HET-like protein [Alternaria alternata]
MPYTHGTILGGKSLRACLGLSPKDASGDSKDLAKSSSADDSAPNTLDARASITHDSDTESSRKAITDLAQSIDFALCDNSKHEKFLPADKLSDFVKEEMIRSAFGPPENSDDTEKLIGFARDKAPRLFLTLVLMESKALKQELKHFQDLHFDDSVLPVGLDRFNRAYTLGNPSNTTLYPLPSQWRRNKRTNFDEYQRRLTVPVFGTPSEFRHQLPDGQRLPFLEEASQPASSGYFGDVSRIVIHAKHVGSSTDLVTFKWPPEMSNQNGDRVEIDAIAIAVKKAKEGDDEPSFSEITRADFFDKEVDNLEGLRGYESPHLIKPIAAFSLGQSRCIMFPWADGGNLGDYWRKFPSHARSRVNVLWQLKQFVGICSAVKELHSSNVRHGDLKPENILWFDPKNNGGSLQIADLGLATFHEKEQRTQLRKDGTKTPSGTSRYEPPEMDAQRKTNKARSRQYDIWSLGCIVFELLLWLAHSPNDIKTFRDNTSYFWKKENGRYSIHEYVMRVMGSLYIIFAPVPAYIDLLNLVRDRLLIVKYSADYEVVPEDCRENADKVHECFSKIVEKCESAKDYLTPLAEKHNYIHPDLGERVSQQSDMYRNEVHERDGKLAVPGQQIVSQSASNASPGLPEILDPGPDIPRLALRQATIVDSNSDTLSSQPTLGANHQEDKAKDCDLCNLLLDALSRKVVGAPRVLHLRNDAAHVGLRDGPNLLSLYSEPDPNAPTPKGAQLGLTQLFDPSTTEFYALLNEWIQVCNADHKPCQRQDDTLTMPTRLIEVGSHLRLVDTAEIQPCRYAALSHCWGSLHKQEMFCTYSSNLSQLKTGFELQSLPRTFRDAVTVARGLSIEYLWIDSLCIIQDDEDDWQSEAGKMEQVFSAAYCTIGASSAQSSLQGFLADRTPRSVVKVPSDTSGAVYACVDIDDFRSDVELSPLNSRGWVLQERALSRRTIFFTSTQVYWECGAGIHCETLSRFRNSKVALLGDANFPTSAVAHYKDGRQLLIQDLYERYSSLAFTMPADRSVAILGLQMRLSRAFTTPAAHGLFEAYFARGLLWKRSDREPMRRIHQPPGRRVPSWSSLSKEGKIQYMDATDELRFKETEWATEDFENPFAISESNANEAEIVVFRGLARRIHVAKRDLSMYIMFDGRSDYEVDGLRCVVIGRGRARNGKLSPRVHVLVIHQTRHSRVYMVWERVGVASLDSSDIENDGNWVDIY